MNCNGFVITLHLRDEFELCEGEVTMRDDKNQPVHLFGVIIVEDGKPRFCYPWELIERFDVAARTITFVRGAELTQLHDGMVEIRLEQWRCGVAPGKVKRLDIVFDTSYAAGAAS